MVKRKNVELQGREAESLRNRSARVQVPAAVRNQEPSAVSCRTEGVSKGKGQ